MIRRAIITTVALYCLIGGTAPASAATSDQIHKDAVDCVLDGDYTLQELRAADSSVGADQREYGCWDEPYAAYLRELAAGPGEKVAPPVVQPKDTNRNGKIDPVEKKAAAKLNKKIKAKFAKAQDRHRSGGAIAAGGGDDDGSDGGTGADASSRSSNDDGGTPWWLLLLLVPLAILAVGAFRLHRTSGARAVEPGAAATRPTLLHRLRPRSQRRVTPVDDGGDMPTRDIGPDRP